jgi:hypothetical protein
VYKKEKEKKRKLTAYSIKKTNKQTNKQRKKKKRKKKAVDDF